MYAFAGALTPDEDRNGRIARYFADMTPRHSLGANVTAKFRAGEYEVDSRLQMDEWDRGFARR